MDKLTSIRGGHCVCIKANEPDVQAWWNFYNQGREGACVGFGSSRMKSLLDRIRYDASELYHATQARRLRRRGGGVRPRRNGGSRYARRCSCRGRSEPIPTALISTYRWALVGRGDPRSSQPASRDQAGGRAVPQQLGAGLPAHRLDAGQVMERLIREDGEVGHRHGRIDGASEDKDGNWQPRPGHGARRVLGGALSRRGWLHGPSS
jgi:hypothetical protein